ncbi:MAG: DUF262 domain-containing protein [Patescibacteria group bacterium]|nr:DUF262 domain-containing protein [Patescibacteria group bacterium]
MSNVEREYFFKDIKGVQMVIPDYQRFYDWEVGLAESLYEDVKSHSGRHEKLFLGAIICKNVKGKLEIIDGQQRLLSLAILLRCLSRNVRLKSSEIQKIDDWFHVVRFKRRTIELHEGKRRDLFNKIICDDYDITEEERRDEIYKHIISSYDKFTELIKAEKSEKKRKEIYNFVTLNIELVVINLSASSDEIEVFEAMNNKRLPLTPIDLIKSLLIEKCRRNGRKRIALMWNRFINQFPDSDAALSFLKDYLDVYSSSDTKKNLEKFKLYDYFKDEHLMRFEGDAIKLMHDLEEKQKFYSELVNVEIKERECAMAFMCLNYLGFKTHYPLFLKVRSKVNINRLVRFANLLEFVMFLKRELFSQMPQDIKDEIFQQMRDFKSRNDLKKIEKYFSSQINGMLQDGAKKKLFESQDLNEKAKKYILFRTIGEGPKKHSRINDYDANSLEHVFPQGKKKLKGNNSFRYDWCIAVNDLLKDSEFKKQIGDRRSKKEIKDYYYDYYIQGIGNMMLLNTLKNSQLQDKSFEEKAELYKEEVGNEHARDVIQCSKRSGKWDSVAIRAHSRWLSETYFKQMRRAIRLR